MCKCGPSAWWQFCPFTLCRRCIVGRVRLKTKGHNRSSGGQNMSMGQAAKNAGSPCELPDMNANASVHSLWLVNEQFPVLNVVGICRLFMVVISSHIGLLHYAIFRLKKHTLSTEVRVCLQKCLFHFEITHESPDFPVFPPAHERSMHLSIRVKLETVKCLKTLQEKHICDLFVTNFWR